jgi:holliday junction DNA helicase RuvA
MIARLIGHLHPLTLDEVVIDVGGVGYHVHVPLGTAGRVTAAEDGRVTLLIHTAVREDAIQLFGFASPQEKAVYRKLIG